jgi:hypothetical protein
MEDHRINVLERLEAADPAPRTPEVDQDRADRVLAAILSEPRRERSGRLRRRRLLVAAIAVIVVGIATPALAFNGSVRSLFDHPESPAVLEESTLLVAAEVAPGTVARLWRSPAKGGGECAFVTFGPPGDVERAPEMGGGACRWPAPGASVGTPLPLSISASKRPLTPKGATSWVPPVVSGGLDAGLGATRVEVRWNGGSQRLALADGHFIGAVEALYEPPASALPFHLVAYDAEGNEVARRKLDPMRFD